MLSFGVCRHCRSTSYISIFFFETTWLIGTKLGWNGHWMVFYWFCIFHVDQPFKLATRAKNIYSEWLKLKIKSSLKAHCRIKCYIVGIILRWSTASFVFFMRIWNLTQKKDCLKNQKWKCKYKRHESLSWCTDSSLHKWRPQCLWVPNLEVQSLHRLQWYKKPCILKNHQWKCNFIWQYNGIILMWGFFGFNFRVRGYGITLHFQQYFSYIVTVRFIGGENRRKSPTCRNSLTNFIT